MRPVELLFIGRSRAVLFVSRAFPPVPLLDSYLNGVPQRENASGKFLRGVRRVFRLPSSRERMTRDDEMEMQMHLDAWIAEFQARGMNAAEAHDAALRRFGDQQDYRTHVAQRAARKARWEAAAEWLAEWRQGIRSALRHFAKSPGFAAIAIVTLPLGIGANTAIYSVIHRLLIAPCPTPTRTASSH